MIQGIRHIILDLGGVILNLDYSATERAFEALGIPDFKNFLRMKVEPNKLTIYPIGLRRTPRRWAWRKSKDRGFGDATGPAIVPARPLRPTLIEGPIEIRVGDLKRREPAAVV